MNPVPVVCECRYQSDSLLSAGQQVADRPPEAFATIADRFGDLTDTLHAIQDSYQTPLMAYRDQLGYNAWRDRIAHLSPPQLPKTRWEALERRK